MKKTLLLIFAFASIVSCNNQAGKEEFKKGKVKQEKVKKEQQDYQGAIADYTIAIEINPKYAEAYYKREVVKLLLGQKDSGCLDLSKAGELGIDGAYDVIKKHCN